MFSYQTQAVPLDPHDQQGNLNEFEFDSVRGSAAGRTSRNVMPVSVRMLVIEYNLDDVEANLDN